MSKERLFEVMGYLDKKFKPKLNENISYNDDPTKEEMREFLKSKYHTEDDFDVESAIYWFANDYHGGQSSNLYSALSTSEFRPGPMHRGIEDEESEMATMMYRDLEDKYAGGSQEAEPELDNSQWMGLSMNEEGNPNIMAFTVREPIIPDAIQAISKNPEAIKFTDKQSYDDFANKQQYFSASHSHAFYSPEEMEQWSKSGNQYVDSDSEQSDMVFETGHELVQVWDNKNQIGYVVPSERKKTTINEEEKWMQDAVKRPGALHKKLGIPEDQEIPMELINKKLAELKKKSEGDKTLSKEDLRFQRQLNFAKNAKNINENLDAMSQINQFRNELDGLVRKFIESGMHKVHVMQVLDKEFDKLDSGE